MSGTSSKSFLHIGGDKDFRDRSDSIFASLNRLEPQKEEEKEPEREILTARRSNRRRPHAVPDHVLHPAKWTEYSLEEDGSEDLARMNANELNKHAAISFLDELKERRKSGERSKSPNKSADCSSRETSSYSGEPSNNKHSFSKPLVGDNKEMDVEMTSLSKQKDGVHIMPEYIIGKTKGPAKTKKIEPVTPQDHGSKKNVQIGHLVQRQEDELLDSDAKDSGIEVSVPKEECEKGKDEVKFAKRKRKQDKNIRKHVKSDEEDKTN